MIKVKIRPLWIIIDCWQTNNKTPQIIFEVYIAVYKCYHWQRFSHFVKSKIMKISLSLRNHMDNPMNSREGFFSAMLLWDHRRKFFYRTHFTQHLDKFHFKWLKIKHYRDRDQSGTSYFDSVMLHNLCVTT